MISKTGKATTNDHLLLKRLEVENKRDNEGDKNYGEAAFGQMDMQNLQKMMNKMMSNNDAEDEDKDEDAELNKIQQIVQQAKFNNFHQEFEKIEQQHKLDSMPLHQKLKRKIAEFKEKKMDDKLISKIIHQERIRDCQASFKTPTRVNMQDVERQKHQSPPMNQYKVKYNLVSPNDYKVISFDKRPTPLSQVQARNLRSNFRAMKICPHAIRTLEQINDLKYDYNIQRASITSSSPRRTIGMTPNSPHRKNQ